MHLSYDYKPIHFFLIVLLSIWILSFILTYLCLQKVIEHSQILLVYAGYATLILINSSAPSIVTLTMIYGSKNKDLIADFWDRLRLHKINCSLIPALFTVPIVILLAIVLSLLFGYSPDQFKLSNYYNIVETQGIMDLLDLFLTAILLNLGWWGYGVDSLRSKYNLFKTSLLLALLWALSVVPFFLFTQYYYSEFLSRNFGDVLLVFMSMLPITILMNWVYYKNDRSLTAIILLQIVYGLFCDLFQTEQFTDCIIIGLLFILSVTIIARDRNLFFENKLTEKI